MVENEHNIWYNNTCRASEKGEWICILDKKILNCTKDIFKVIKLIIIAVAIVLLVVVIKFKPVYKVTISGTEIGYVNNKKEFEELVDNEIANPTDSKIAFIDLEEKPSFELAYISSVEADEQEVMDNILKIADITYKLYAIDVEGQTTTYVNSKEEAEETIAKIKEEYSEKLEAENLNITLTDYFTKDLSSINTVEVASAVEETEIQVAKIVEEKEQIRLSTFEGIYFSTKPVQGVITSRYGAVESIRDHTHKGIDIGAPLGTKIYAAAAGKVTYSDWMSGYGYLVIIDHGNGVETYYGHCSKLYVSVGEEVEAGEVIAAVGSTGNSTGNHLHFEIRKDGNQVNPQIYVYR